MKQTEPSPLHVLEIDILQPLHLRLELGLIEKDSAGTAHGGAVVGVETENGVCVMGGIDGFISSLGSQYVLGLRAKDCRAGELLYDQQLQVAQKKICFTRQAGWPTISGASPENHSQP